MCNIKFEPVNIRKELDVLNDDFDEDDFVDSYEEEDYPTNSRRRYIVK